MASSALGLFLLLVCVPDTGHLIPMLNIATHLLRQPGVERVLLASLVDAQSRVEAQGIEFLSLDLPNATSRSEEAGGDPDSLTQAMIGIMTPNLITYLRQSEARPHALVVDGLTMPGWLAAELLQIPLVLVYPLPLSPALVFSGHSWYNMPPHVPFPGFLEQIGALQRYLFGPFYKMVFAEMLWGGQSKRWNPVRKSYGLPALGRSAVLTRKLAVLYLMGTTLELEVARRLPANMHVVGPLSTHRDAFVQAAAGTERTAQQSADPAQESLGGAADGGGPHISASVPESPSIASPPAAPGPTPLSPEDAAAAAFLDQAQADGVPVVYVATGTRIMLEDELLEVMSTAFRQLARTTGSTGTGSTGTGSTGAAGTCTADAGSGTAGAASAGADGACSSDAGCGSTGTPGGSTDSGGTDTGRRAAGSAAAARFLWAMPWSRRSKTAGRAGVPPYFDPGAGILVLPWVDQPAVLRHPAVKLFLSHCGLGSTHEGLMAGKPILAMPFRADQPTLANQVQSRGYGVRIDPYPTPPLSSAQLQQALSSMLEEPLGPWYAHNARAAGERLRAQTPGAVNAAELTVDFVKGCYAQ